MALLGNLDAVRQMIRASSDWDMGSDIDARLLLIQGAVSAALEDKLGRTFGTVAADTSHLLWAEAGSALVLPKPARTITSITVGGTVTGSTMTGGTTYLASTLQNIIVDEDGLIYAIGANATGSTGWWGTAYWSTLYRGYPMAYPVVVTGDFADTDDDATIPADVTYAATYLIAERLKVENAGPAGFLGPEGVVPIRDAWKDSMVQAVIAKYGIHRKVMAV